MASCDGLQYIPSPSDAQDLYSTYICNIVFNSILSFTAIMLNVTTILAMKKTSSIPQPLKTLLLSLAVSDLGVGALVQSFYVSLLVRWSRSQTNYSDCNVFHLLVVVIGFFSEASFFGVVAISVDRFLAIHLQLRYQEFITHKRKAYCCSGDLNMAAECISFFNVFLVSNWHQLRHFLYYRSCLSSRYSNSLF